VGKSGVEDNGMEELAISLHELTEFDAISPIVIKFSTSDEEGRALLSELISHEGGKDLRIFTMFSLKFIDGSFYFTCPDSS
jgi:hypothetical protein